MNEDRLGAGRPAGRDRHRTSGHPYAVPASILFAVLLTMVGCGGSSNASESGTSPTEPGPTEPEPPPLPEGGAPTLGLEFPGSDDVDTTMRFRFDDPLAIYPATYIWRAYPRRQTGYFTAFFWGNDDGNGNLDTFLWDDSPHPGNSYYGFHPYPQPPRTGNDHKWEISVEQDDYLGADVVYDQWYLQVARVWEDPDSGEKHHEFYWNWPDTSDVIRHTAPSTYGNKNPPAPHLTWGDAPWAPGKEVWDGVLTGIQIYSTRLSIDEIADEIEAPLSTSAGAAGIWYLNIEPTPDDIANKWGQGNDPEWVGNERPTLWVK
jgi:hypothetical protein